MHALQTNYVRYVELEYARRVLFRCRASRTLKRSI